MFNTPPHNMVRTRGMLRKEQQNDRQQDDILSEPPGPDTMRYPPPSTSRNALLEGTIKRDGLNRTTLPGGSIKSEPPLQQPLLPRNVEKSKSVKSCKLSTSSIRARKAQMILEAERLKAKIQMDLIDKKLAADIADLESEVEEEYSPLDVEVNKNVEKWVNSSYYEIEGNVPRKSHPPQTSSICGERSARVIPEQTKPEPSVQMVTTATAPPPPPAVDDVPSFSGAPFMSTAQNNENTLNVLANALQQIAVSAVSNKSDSKLLSRLSTHRDLPEFSGDPLEWLQFKHAYHESTALCKFTPQENLWRLRKCLRGLAKEATFALFVSASSPETIMSTLQLRFGNPDYILSKIVSDIKRLQPMCSEYQKDIVTFSVKIQNFVEAVRAVGREEYLQGMEISAIILSKFLTVLLSKWSDYSYPLIVEQNGKSRLVILSEFLKNEAIKTSYTASTLHYTTTRNDIVSYKKKCYDGSIQRSHAVLLQTEDKSSMCTFCQAAIHKLTECKQFKRALRKVRWQHVKRNKICYKCLIARHDRAACTAPVCDEKDCGQSHHRLLHYPVRSSASSERRTPGPQPQLEPQPSSPPENDNTEIVTYINASDNKVLLKIVPIRIRGPSGIINTNALCDDGSTVSLISAELANRAGVRGHTETMRVCGAWDNTELICDATVVNMDLISIDDKVHSVRLRSVKNLNLPYNNYLSLSHYENCKHLYDLKDKLCINNVKPEILIGQDNFHLLLPLEVRVGKTYEPCATLTALGWCLHGSTRVPRTVPGGRPRWNGSFIAHSTLCVSATEVSTKEDHELRDLHDMVRRTFTLDSVGISGKPRQNINDVRAISQLENSARHIDGRWHVSLPWRDENCHMPDSYPNALKRLKSIERKMNRDKGFAERYRERIQHLFDNDFAQELHDTTPTKKTWYLPHFGVDNPNKKKLRLVFDAASEVNGVSLNTYLFTGPDLLSSLFGILLRFRQNRIAVTGDIKDMFLRIKINSNDQHALRFLWRDNPNVPVRTFVMTSLIFGANCSPFVAQFIKNRNALRYELSLPAAVNAIHYSHYMDDYIDSLPDQASAIEMVSNVTRIHKDGGFEIRNWTSNSIQVLDSVSKQSLGTAAVQFKVGQQYEGERTLGLIWYPQEDVLAFDLSFKKIPCNIIDKNSKCRPTKRLMLRIIMSIFDVLGFLAPFTIQGRIMLQDTWRLNIGWDDVIPDVIYNKWILWLDLMQEVSRLRIPRCYMFACSSETATRAVADTGAARTVREVGADSHAPVAIPCALRAPPHPARDASAPPFATTSVANVTSHYNNLQLHLFSDASTKAMCAVAYWRWTQNDNVYVAFITSKCRVVGLKPVTVPRSELQAAVLSARLADTILKEHKMEPQRRFFWCDSTVVLHWLRNKERTYKTFEANRLGEIDEITRADEWRYVPTKMNVADLATREEFDHSLFHGEWITGPRFLYNDESSWPKDICHQQEIVETSTEHILVAQDLPVTLPVPDPEQFSSWLKLLHVTANVLKFIKRCKKLTCDVDCNTMEEAERMLLKQSQCDAFPEDVTALKHEKGIARNSKLRNLSPYLDKFGILRLGGRADSALDIPLDRKRPIILDGRHPVSQLIIRHYHVKAAHGNQESVVNELKQRYWMIRLRPAVKHVTSKCMFCRIRRAQPVVPRMGDLPVARMAHHQRPFTFCGLDLFGPMVVTVGRRREKRYGVLFTCLTIRAVHVELVSSLTADSLIMAMRRMAARRGWPRHLYSDNGSNIRRADKELQQSTRELMALKAEGANNGMQFNFIPPASPNWGGAWERLIRSVKTSLRVVLNERAPKEEVLSTLLAEVENIVNSRPLSHVSVEAGSVETLTPNHFLLGSSSNLPTMGIFDDSDLYLKKLWRKAQRLTDMFWQRWVREIFPALLPRPK